MNLKNNEIVRVRVTTGKAKKWWATDNVAKKDLENYKAMTTTDLRNYCIKPTTTINFEIYEIARAFGEAFVMIFRISTLQLANITK